MGRKSPSKKELHFNPSRRDSVFENVVFVKFENVVFVNICK
jgi:hypothetical protein